MGQVGGACLRLVRTIFDRTNADPNAELVLGEVITLPGRWSSYPPHHHPQPEIYHYRFTHPQGYGHAELGEDVLLVPTYTPLRTDETNVSIDRIFFGGINVYLQQKSALFRHTPWWFDRLLDNPALLERAIRGAASVDPTQALQAV